MKLVYLKRNYLFNKVTKKTELPRHFIYLLYTIYILQPAGFNAIFFKMQFVRRQINGRDYSKWLKYLLAEGYCMKEDNKYNLTPAGLEVLKDCERRLRIERHDR